MGSTMVKRKGGALIYCGVAMLVILAIALAALSGYVNDKLCQNGEQQATTFTEQVGSFVGEEAEAIQDAIGAFTIQSDDPALVQPALASLGERFEFSGVAFARMDGRGITAEGEPFDVADLGVAETALSQGRASYSESFQSPDGVYTRVAQEPLFISGAQVGALYVQIPLSVFSVDSARVTRGVIGDTLLFDGTTGEVLLNFGDGTNVPEGSSVYDFVGGALDAGADRNVKMVGEVQSDVESLRNAVVHGESALAVGLVDGRDSYLCVAPTGRGSWYVCNVISVEAVRSEASVISAVFAVVLVLSAACVLLSAAVAVALYRKRSRESNLEMKQTLYQALSDSLDFGVILYSPADGEVTPIVAKSVNIFGASLEDLIKDPDKARELGVSPRGCAVLRRIKENGVSFFERGEFAFEAPRGNRARYVEYTVRPLRYENKGQVLVIIRDVTEANLIQLSMKEAMEAAEAANNAKSEFLSRMSHEIRTPMNVIIGKLAIARKHLDDPARTEANLADIERASDHLLELINGVLDISKIESGKVNLDDRPFNLSHLLQSVDDVVRPQCDEKSQSFTRQAEGPVDAVFLGDETRLRQLLVNLLTNASKYTEEGGHIELGVKVEPSLAAGYECITFVVADDGIGMAPEFVEHLFEPFVMEGRSRSEGTGLGMPIVKQIVNALGGDIHVETEVGKGTTYTIVVNKKMLADAPSTILGSRADEGEGAVSPSAAAAAPAGQATHPSASGAGEPAGRDGAEAQPARAAAGSFDFGGLRVLLAEDSDLNAEIATELLADEGMVVDWAEDGQKACEMFASSDPGTYDVVLMDVRMPRMTGLEATAAIRAMARPDAATVPIIAMSANAFSEDVAKSLDAGMNMHLSKPIDIKKVLAALAELIG